MLTMIEILSQEIENKVGIDLVFVLLGAIDRKHETTSFLVLGVLPLRLNALLEILHRVYFPPFLFN